MRPVYEPLSLARVGDLAAGADDSRRWRLIAEFLEDYRWEPPGTRLALLEDEPRGTGDERWDVFLAALAEHVAARDGHGARRGLSCDRCDGCGSLSILARPGWTRSYTRPRRSAGAGCTWHRRN